jgi:hypothetical protein
MRTIFMVLVMLLGAAPVLAATPDATAPRAAIDSFIAAFNAGDAAAAKATHEASPTIIDEPPPYLWSGRDSFDRWVADQHKEAVARGRSAEKVVLGKTRRAEMSDAVAYVIVPATYSYVEKGAALAEPSQMTFVLKKGRSGWRISAWSWTGPRGRPVASKPAA